MDTFGSLIRGVLPPAGNRVCLRPGAGIAPDTLFPDGHLYRVDSGTSALALALGDARARQPNRAPSEVVIPAYCCPDLVAAALSAGLVPVLADLSPDSCQYDRNSLNDALGDQTVAVIAVNFLGLKPDVEGLRARTGPDVAIIEDCAQWFPEQSSPAPLMADYRVFSFGRGKPVSLLGGGLLQARKAVDAPTISPGPDSVLGTFKCAAYNALRHPVLYQLLARNPLLRLGETRFHPHERITAMSPFRQRRLARNIPAYQAHDRETESVYRQALSDLNRLGPALAREPGRLLRYPLLTPDRQSRDRLLEQLTRDGLGATALYRDTLPRIPGIPSGRLRILGERQAQSFAQRLLTLPLHQGVQPAHRERTLQRVREVLGR